jgi:hypothetical protein
MILFTCCIALTACGGGDDSSPTNGGGDNGSTGPDIQTTVPEPTYPAGSGESTYFQFINQVRQQLGMGLLAQNPLLDTVSRNHARYLDSSGTSDEIVSGIEDPAKPNFSGAAAQDRCVAVGYSGLCPQTSMWSEAIYQEHPSPYLGLTILSQGARQIGLAMHTTALFTGTFNGPEVQLGFPAGTTPQKQAAGYVMSTHLWGAFHVQINEGETLIVDAFHIWNALGQEVVGDILTNGTDPLRRVPPHAVMLVPSSGSVRCDGSTYSIYLAGKRDGVPFTHTRSLTLTPYLHCM